MSDPQQRRGFGARLSGAFGRMFLFFLNVTILLLIVLAFLVWRSVSGVLLIQERTTEYVDGLTPLVFQAQSDIKGLRADLAKLSDTADPATAETVARVQGLVTRLETNLGGALSDLPKIPDDPVPMLTDFMQNAAKIGTDAAREIIGCVADKTPDLVLPES